MSTKESAKRKAQSVKQTGQKTKKKAGLEIDVYNLKGEKSGKVKLNKEIFDVEASPRLLAQYVRVYLANQRAGTASTKTRGEVRGSTRKIYPQKGTGRARHGDIKAPIFVGGGVVFGPKPRDFSLKINKKQRRKALFYSLTLKAREGAVAALEDRFLKEMKKTKQFAEFLKIIGVNGERVLVVMPAQEKYYLQRAVRNIPKVEPADAESLNPYIVLRAKRIFFVKKSFEILEKVFLKKDAAK